MSVYCKDCGALVMAVGSLADAARQYSKRADDGTLLEAPCPFCWSNPANRGSIVAAFKAGKGQLQEG